MGCHVVGECPIRSGSVPGAVLVRWNATLVVQRFQLVETAGRGFGTLARQADQGEEVRKLVAQSAVLAVGVQHVVERGVHQDRIVETHASEGQAHVLVQCRPSAVQRTDMQAILLLRAEEVTGPASAGLAMPRTKPGAARTSRRESSNRCT